MSLELSCSNFISKFIMNIHKLFFLVFSPWDYTDPGIGSGNLVYSSSSSTYSIRYESTAWKLVLIYNNLLSMFSIFFGINTT